jgi:hypothetical protein
MPYQTVHTSPTAIAITLEPPHLHNVPRASVETTSACNKLTGRTKALFCWRSPLHKEAKKNSNQSEFDFPMQTTWYKTYQTFIPTPPSLSLVNSLYKVIFTDPALRSNPGTVNPPSLAEHHPLCNSSRLQARKAEGLARQSPSIDIQQARFPKPPAKPLPHTSLYLPKPIPTNICSSQMKSACQKKEVRSVHEQTAELMPR